MFDEFRSIAAKLVYQFCSNQLVDSFFVGFHVLRSIGEDVNQHLRYVAFNTSKRLVRWRLLKHLRHMGQIDK